MNINNLSKLIENIISIGEAPKPLSSDRQVVELSGFIKSILTAGQEAIICIDSKGRIIFWNNIAELIFLYRSDEMIGKNVTVLVKDQLRKKYKAKYNKLFKNKHPFSFEKFEFACLRKDKSEFTAEHTLTNWNIEDNLIITGIICDVTEKKQLDQAQESLQNGVQSRIDFYTKVIRSAESERLLRFITENLIEAIFIYDKNRNLIYANYAFERLTGYSIDEVKAHQIHYVHSDDKAKILKLWDDLFSGIAVEGEEIRIVTKKGEVKWCLVHLNPQLDKDGHQSYVIGSFLDITDRKLADETLKNKQSQIEDLLVNIKAIIMESNPFEVTFVSGQVEELLGNPLKDWFSHSGGALGFWLEHVHPADQKRVAAYCEESICNCKDHVQEYRMIKSDGTEIWVQETVSVESDKGMPVKARAIVVDITECKKVELALLEGEKRFKDVAQNVLEWIWEVDTNGKYTYSSSAVEEMLGYAPDEVLSMHFYDLFHPEDRENLKKEAFEVFIKKESFRKFISRNVHKDGMSVWLSTSGVPVINESGELIGYRGTDMDITEIMERDLRKKSHN